MQTQPLRWSPASQLAASQPAINGLAPGPASANIYEEAREVARSEVLPLFFRPIRQSSIGASLSPSVLFHLASSLLALSTPRSAVSSHLPSHKPTVATTLLHVRIVLALFEGTIVTTLLSTAWDRLSLGL
jgi:hypothetical protein